MSFVSAKDNDDNIGHEIMIFSGLDSPGLSNQDPTVAESSHEVVTDFMQDADDFEHASNISETIGKTTRDTNQFICRTNGICVQVPPVGPSFCTLGPFGRIVDCDCFDFGNCGNFDNRFRDYDYRDCDSSCSDSSDSDSD